MASAAPFTDRRIAGLYVLDGLRVRNEHATLSWLRDIRSALEYVKNGWEAVPIVVLTPGATRAAWWRQRRRLWSANYWDDDHLLIHDLGVEEAYGLVLVR